MDDMPVPPVKLFGTKWEGSPIWEECETVPTPVGSECFNCHNKIRRSQSGVFMWDASTGEYTPWHRLCFLMPILGSLAQHI